MRVDITEREAVPVLSRPWFEFYRREGDVDIFVPIEPALRVSAARRH